MVEPDAAIDTWIALQRGRARAGAECLHVFIGLVIVLDGFNGAAPARARNAVPGVHKPQDCPGGFNGAAPARARNDFESCVKLWQARSGFNGAAPARARNGARDSRI